MNASHAPRLALLPLALASLAVPARAQYDSEFMKEFRKLMAINAQDEMVDLLRKNQDVASRAVIEICVTISAGSSDQLETEISALNKTWKKAFDSKFVDIEYNYFSVDLVREYKKRRWELKDQYEAKRKEYETAAKAKDLSKLGPLGLDFNALGDQFAQIGDHYMAASAYSVYASCFDDTLNGSKADYRKACEGWGLYLAGREKIDFKDRSYNEAKLHYDDLVSKGFAEPAPETAAGGEAGAGAAPAVAATPASNAAAMGGAFQLVPDIEAIQRPSYLGDANYQIWSALNLGKQDSVAKIASMENSPNVKRTAALKASVDVDGDGKGDVDIPLTGKISPVQITLTSGTHKQPWAFLAVIGLQQDTYQGFKFNLSPDENQMTIYIAPAASLVGTINGVRVQVIDDNMDGLYGSPAKTWNYVGLRDGAHQTDVDSVVVGDSKVARPWSKLQKIGDAWFELDPNESGTDILATRVDVKTGTLQLDMKGLDAAWLIVHGLGQEKDRMFDVANGGTNKVEVPAGSYELVGGEVTSGKKTQMMKALIVPGASARTWKVDPGGTTKVELGAPFSMDFSFKQDEKTVTVDGASIAVTGRGGETYQRLWNCVLAPEVNLRKSGSGKGKKEGKMVPVTSQEELQDQKNDFKTVWFPVGEAIKKNNEGEKLDVQLFEKKNKLFGKIESAWKAD